jgi:hypothetical protein
MKHLLLFATLIILACGVSDKTGSFDLSGEETERPNTASTAKGLVLQPEIVPEGINDLYSRLTVTDLKFFGALHLIPAAGTVTMTAQSTAFKFEMANGEAQTHTMGRPLRVFGQGEYHVLMTIHPFEGGYSVDVAGSVKTPTGEASPDRKGCLDEAAPTTADDKEMEAAPTTADEEEMEAAPTTADEDEMEAAPTTADEDEMEAAPTTADEEETEAAPITANEGEMEAAPTTADEGSQATDRGRQQELCLWESRYAGGSKFETSSADSYEFDLGTVSIHAGDEHLILNWDMSDWMGLVMGEALGLSFIEMVALHQALSEMGSGEDTEDEFSPDRVRLEAN